MISPLILTKWGGVTVFPWDEIVVNCLDRMGDIIVDFDFVYKEKPYYCYFYRSDVTPSTVLSWLKYTMGYGIVCKITDTIYEVPSSSYSQVIRCKTFQEVKLFLERLTIIDRL